MAEVIGLVASGISIGTLAVQISHSLQTLHAFCTAVRNAPRDIKDTLAEIDVLNQILLDLKDEMSKTNSLGLAEGAAGRCLHYCQTAADELSLLVTKLDMGISNGGSYRLWASMKRVFNREVFKEVQNRLERAKTMLNLVVSMLVTLLKIMS